MEIVFRNIKNIYFVGIGGIGFGSLFPAKRIPGRGV